MNESSNPSRLNPTELTPANDRGSLPAFTYGGISLRTLAPPATKA